MGLQQHELLEVSILFLVGEGERRFSALCLLRDVGRYLVQATPLAITEIGGGVDVLLKHQLQGKPIEALFIDFNDARDGIRAWVWKFVEDNASDYR